MKLNYECLRDVLLSLEEHLQMNEELESNDLCIETICATLPTYTKQDVVYTLVKLKEADMIQAHIVDADDGIYEILVFDITFAGHEFLNSIRPKAVWEKAKPIISKVGAASIFIIQQIIAPILDEYVRSNISF